MTLVGRLEDLDVATEFGFVPPAAAETSGDHPRFELRDRPEDLPDEGPHGVVGHDLAGVDRKHSAVRSPDLLQARLLEC